jgi:hypothetical protein
MVSTRTRWIAGLFLLVAAISVIAWLLIGAEQRLPEEPATGRAEDGRATLNDANVRELERRFERKTVETAAAEPREPASQVAPKTRAPAPPRAEQRLRGGTAKGTRSGRGTPAQPASPSASPGAVTSAPAAPSRPSNATPVNGPTNPGARSKGDVREIVDNWLETLPWANIAFNAPSPMRFQRSVEIQLVLSSEKDIDGLLMQLSAPGSKEGAEVQVSSAMRANLTGRGFDIVAIRPEEQAVGTSGITEWRWEVTPTSDQPRSLLHLTLTALVSVDRSPVPIAVKTFDRWVAIEVTWTQRLSAFVGDYWQWLWAAVLVPLAAGIWRKIKAYRRLSSRSPEVVHDERLARGVPAGPTARLLKHPG